MANVLLILAWVLVLVVSRWFVLMGLVSAAAFRNHLLGSRPVLAAGSPTRFLFVIPAHDEASVVGVTVKSCLAVAYDPQWFQVAVIADNCTDETASIAAAAGALVVVRADLDRKSKGFALEDFFNGR